MTEPAHIELAEVCKRFGARAILENAHLSVKRGEFLVVVGRSGSGKSTLLKLIGGLDRADSGRIAHAGRDIDALSERELAAFRRSALGFVFQFFNLIPTLSVIENVMLPLALNRIGAQERARAAERALEELEIGECAERFPDELSGGEQQRVAIARAVVHEPALVVADEPTGNLDDETADRVLDRLEDSCRSRQTTLIMATHSRDAAARADRTVTIAHGRLEAAAP